MKNAVVGTSNAKNDADSRVSLFEGVDIEGIGVVFEQLARDDGYQVIAGVDEVGRGCIADPVVAAACVLDLSRPLPDDLNDSKKLTADQRERIAAELEEHAVAYAIGEVDASEIDRINILEATKRAMLLAIEALSPAPDFLLIDALELRHCALPQRGIIKGDSISASIAAASVLAKVYRDRLMSSYHEQYPHYGFDSNKGYGAAAHWRGINEHGPCAIHRMSFHGVRPLEKTANSLFGDQ